MDLHGEIRALALPLSDPADLDPLLDRIGHARVVLLGEASHGTSEFYQWRTALTRRLVDEHGFRFVAVEGDWPDCQRVDRYVQEGVGRSAREVLGRYERWPTWMWANEEVVELVEWMRSSRARPGFHGLDVYSLRDSLAQVLAWVRQNDPDAVPAAIDAAECLQRGDARRYRLVQESCEDEVVELLSAIRRSGHGDGDRFGAEQNAWVVRSADQYYRAVVRGGPHSWNVRDRHMADTLERLLAHHGPGARGVVWAHNTHIGDARFTDMARVGMLNLGQLARERLGEDQVALVGFATWSGTVVAARDWEAPVATMSVPPARAGSWEELLHEAVGENALLLLHEAGPALAEAERDQRAIGVVYRPENERGNYVPTVLTGRYDALLYLDRTRALHPLGPAEVPREEEPPETFPTGF